MNKTNIIPRVCFFSALCAYTLHRSTTNICKRVGLHQSCPWVGMTRGLCWAGLGSGSEIFVFSGLGWVMGLKWRICEKLKSCM